MGRPALPDFPPVALGALFGADGDGVGLFAPDFGFEEIGKIVGPDVQAHGGEARIDGAQSVFGAEIAVGGNGDNAAVIVAIVVDEFKSARVDHGGQEFREDADFDFRILIGEPGSQRGKQEAFYAAHDGGVDNGIPRVVGS